MMDGTAKPAKERMRLSRERKVWLSLTWCLTWFIPPCCVSRSKAVRIAWREKVAICMLIAFVSGALIFILAGVGPLICPLQNVLSVAELNTETDINKPVAYAYGRYYDLKSTISSHKNGYGVEEFKFIDILGKDVSALFHKNLKFEQHCPGLPVPDADWDSLSNRPNPIYDHKSFDGKTKTFVEYLEYMNGNELGLVAWSLPYIKKISSPKLKLLVIGPNVYDVSAYFNSQIKFFGPNVESIFSNFYGQDATRQWLQLEKYDPKTDLYLNCMNNLFYIGTVDMRNSLPCRISNFILLSFTIIIVALVGGKFIAAVSCGFVITPEPMNKNVVVQVPIYTESYDSITSTLESIAGLNYKKENLLLFITVDGILTGAGNDFETHKIVERILGNETENKCHFYESLGEGDLKNNRAYISTGYYECKNNQIPYVLVVKCGNESETFRRGNRGKRDSQSILLRFLSRVHFQMAMNPLELQIYHQLQSIGINPGIFEFCLMVDADTIVAADSLNHFVSTMVKDTRIVGLCGETLIANEKSSWIAAIQVYEYFISHHLAKNFESMFGSVTCLPGCFCMYRIKTGKNKPLLISPKLIKEYCLRRVDTLHLKNLLLLGEDRYLTTLVMKTFPSMRLCFNSQATCQTIVPSQWSILLSQRRRWTNSTIHNLIELLRLKELCGFCCFSMRFFVFFDLFSTVVQPAGLLYIAYLCFSLVVNSEAFPTVSLIMLCSVYGLQAVIFMLKRQWAMIGWMIIYILAMPLYAFVVPLYSFWNMDDFAWGSTRIVAAENQDDNDDEYAFDLQKPNNYSITETALKVPASVNVIDPQHSNMRNIDNWISKQVLMHSTASSSESSTKSSAFSSSVPEARIKFSIPDATSSNIKRNKTPSDAVLKTEIKGILASNISNLTPKMVRNKLEHRFNCDLSEKRHIIAQMIEEVVETYNK